MRAILLLVIAAVAFAQTNLYEGKPNIVLIVADDLGYGQLSCYPHPPEVSSPNIDRLATAGMLMTDGYSAHPMCWPSRASILTGRYYQRFLKGQQVPRTERMIGQYLTKSGYATGCVGKWHNTGSIGAWDGNPQNHPIGWGFDSFFGFLGGMHNYFDSDAGTHVIQGRNRPFFMPFYDNVQPVRETKYATEEFTDRAIDFITRHSRRPWPFFLYLSYNAIHTPLEAPEAYLERHPNDARLAMLESMDDNVGRVLDTLRQLGLQRNTMVWFVGDNGGTINTNGNWKLRSGKSLHWEGGIRVPFLVSWPERLPSGVEYSHPVMHIDVLPTILAAGRAEVPQDRELDGKNLLPYWEGSISDPPHEVLFWGEPNRDRFAVRRGKWKLIREREKRDGEYELALYDLEGDISEKDNLLEQQPTIVRELTESRQAWLTSVTPSGR